MPRAAAAAAMASPFSLYLVVELPTGPTTITARLGTGSAATRRRPSAVAAWRPECATLAAAGPEKLVSARTTNAATIAMREVRRRAPLGWAAIVTLMKDDSGLSPGGDPRGAPRSVVTGSSD